MLHQGVLTTPPTSALRELDKVVLRLGPIQAKLLRDRSRGELPRAAKPRSLSRGSSTARYGGLWMEEFSWRSARNDRRETVPFSRSIPLRKGSRLQRSPMSRLVQGATRIVQTANSPLRSVATARSLWFQQKCWRR